MIMLKRMMACFAISSLLVSGICLGGQAEVSVTALRSPLQVRIRVDAAGRSSYKFSCGVYNGGNEDIIDSMAELTVRNDSGYETIQKKELRTLKAGGTKNLSWTVKGLRPGTYTATVVVRGYNQERTHLHIMGDRTSFSIGTVLSNVYVLFRMIAQSLRH